MSGFLQHLVARTLAPRLDLRPRPTQLFETLAEAAATMSEADSNLQRPAVTPLPPDDRTRHREDAAAPRPAASVRGWEPPSLDEQARAPTQAPPGRMASAAEAQVPAKPFAAQQVLPMPSDRADVAIEIAPTRSMARAAVPAWPTEAAVQDVPRVGTRRPAEAAPGLDRPASVAPLLTPLPVYRAAPERLVSLGRAGAAGPAPMRRPAERDTPWLPPAAEAASVAVRRSGPAPQDAVPAPRSTALLPMPTHRVPADPTPGSAELSVEQPATKVPRPDAAPVRATAVVPVPRPAAPPEVTRPRGAQAASQEPVVQVTIGRIEIRAAAPAPGPAPTPRRAGPHKPAVSLGDYLRRRQGGGG